MVRHFANASSWAAKFEQLMQLKRLTLEEAISHAHLAAASSSMRR